MTTFHDLFVLTAEYSTPDFRSRFVQQAKIAAETSDIIIAVSQFTADQVCKLLGVQPGRVRVVHHGVHKPPAGFSRRPEKLVLHVGAIQERKNIARLVTAFEALPADWTLVLAGGAGYGYAGIMQHIQASSAAARVRVAGYVTQAQLEDLYARAGIFAFPSLDEGFGMPVLEAMVRGIPVLTSNRSALREIALNAALVVHPEDTAGIANGMLRLSEDVPFWHDLVARGYRRAKEFTWDRTIEAIWSIYEELTGSLRRQRS